MRAGLGVRSVLPDPSFAGMVVGESIFHPMPPASGLATRNYLRNQFGMRMRNRAKRVGMKLEIVAAEEGGVEGCRIWRVE